MVKILFFFFHKYTYTLEKEQHHVLHQVSIFVLLFFSKYSRSLVVGFFSSYNGVNNVPVMSRV